MLCLPTKKHVNNDAEYLLNGNESEECLEEIQELQRSLSGGIAQLNLQILRVLRMSLLPSPPRCALSSLSKHLRS